MSMRTNKLHLILLAAISLFLLASLACSVGGLTIGKNSATLDVTLTQDQVNTILQNSYVNSSTDQNRPFDKITKVEMHDGYMRIFGTKTQDGKTVEGSFDVSISADNNQLNVKIIKVDIPGVDANDPRIANANQEIANELSKSVTESNGQVQYQQAQITEGQLKLTVQVNYNNANK